MFQDRLFRRTWRNCLRVLLDYYQAPYRSAVLREKYDEDYLFQLFVFMELLGLENPLTAYTLELQALILQDFHEWHLRAGSAHSPFDHIPCC